MSGSDSANEPIYDTDAPHIDALLLRLEQLIAIHATEKHHVDNREPAELSGPRNISRE